MYMRTEFSVFSNMGENKIITSHEHMKKDRYKDYHYERFWHVCWNIDAIKLIFFIADSKKVFTKNV